MPKAGPVLYVGASMYTNQTQTLHLLTLTSYLTSISRILTFLEFLILILKDPRQSHDPSHL